MPFVKKIETEVGVLGIWKVSEPAETLRSELNFSESEKLEFEKLRFEKRQVEYLASRLLLNELLDSKTEIFYNQPGKPFLKNNPLHISISHSSDFVVLILSKQNTGIDVEQLNRNIDKVANRFLSQSELMDVQSSSNPQTARIIYWGAKESIFKCTHFHGVQFNTQILINAFQIEKEGFFEGKLIAENQVEFYKLWYFTIENNMVVYCVENRNNLQ